MSKTPEEISLGLIETHFDSLPDDYWEKEHFDNLILPEHQKKRLTKQINSLTKEQFDYFVKLYQTKEKISYRFSSAFHSFLHSSTEAVILKNWQVKKFYKKDIIDASVIYQYKGYYFCYQSMIHECTILPILTKPIVIKRRSIHFYEDPPRDCKELLTGYTETIKACLDGYWYPSKVHTTQLSLLDYSLVNSNKDTEFFENMYFHFNNGEVLQFNKKLGTEWFGCPFLLDSIKLLIKSKLS
jgi:hypothetical protein